MICLEFVIWNLPFACAILTELTSDQPAYQEYHFDHQSWPCIDCQIPHLLRRYRCGRCCVLRKLSSLYGAWAQSVSERTGRSIREYQDDGILFIVVEVNLKYRSPAGLDDDLIVETWIAQSRRSSVTFGQRIKREGEDNVLVEGSVKIACIGTTLRPRRLPQELLDVMGN